MEILGSCPRYVKSKSQTKITWKCSQKLVSRKVANGLLLTKYRSEEKEKTKPEVKKRYGG